MSGQHDAAGLSADDEMLAKPFTHDVLVAAVNAAMPPNAAASLTGGRGLA